MERPIWRSSAARRGGGGGDHLTVIFTPLPLSLADLSACADGFESLEEVEGPLSAPEELEPFFISHLLEAKHTSLSPRATRHPTIRWRWRGCGVPLFCCFCWRRVRPLSVLSAESRGRLRKSSSLSSHCFFAPHEERWDRDALDSC